MGISKTIKSLLPRNRKWLPIIDESGMVHGKITSSESIHKKNGYLHPIVRIALIHKGKLFLSEKGNTGVNGKPCPDYPFERHVLYEETVEEAVGKIFASNGSKPELADSCTYLFHYIHHSGQMHRMVYFYICNIRDDSLLEKINLRGGKWWLRKQIKENLNTGLFSSFFENEFEFLDSTVLAIE